MKSSHGMTLIELVVTLLVLTILISTALPSFSSWMRASRADASISEISSLAKLARNHAISYGIRVTICPIDQGCCTDDWNAGFAVFSDTGKLSCIDGTDKLIKTYPAIAPGDSLTYSRSALRFLPDGLASGTNGTFRYCPKAADSLHAESLIISNAGRIRRSSTGVVCN